MTDQTSVIFWVTLLKNDFFVCLEFGGKNEEKALRSAACKWLNSPNENGGQVKKNYERWSYEGRTKQKLKIGGIFPKSGNKYVAPELMPGKKLSNLN